ncbi:VOC family protein [Streptomyces sp. NPDC051567]|uniref:VOC family protein n=1 Tax=Streptomyces sp. NPDC051567 TaxID=3365660 RepID=UPI003788B34D
MTGTGRGASVTNGGASVFPALLHRDARAVIRQLTEAFGFTPVAVHEDDDGVVLHAELSYGNGAVMPGSKGRGGAFDRAMEGAGPTGVHVVVGAVDAHHRRRAVEHGVEILVAPADQEYGSRDCTARDAEGNVWSFGTYAPRL